ncbi:hypothetical protein LB941_07610 [Ligilactobacillus sp. WILCCON 0076]|uniref:YfhO family protein n=1 Tax=Ligilactobacillus ubinensis TaxID=2876789 RepID=A0A9X2FL40_9LACO|nr:6-pyruvoyl-tetrahydropterin synthase-related protein [Ligilactobacillus ubinensis]MCP0887199.1 hypothetical protein [Ligilactobacillus ubinensis]
MQQKRIFQKAALVLFFAVLSMIYVVLAWHTKTILVGDDRIFHIERLEEAYQDINNGHFISMISTYSFGKVGQAINTYYPWGNLLFYVPIRMLLRNPITAYYSYLVLEQFLGLILAYIFGHRLMKRKDAAIVFAILLRFSVYIMFNDFGRADIGESWAFVFVPLVFLGMYYILKEVYVKGAICLVLGLTAEMYCHLLTTVFTIGLLLVVYLLTFIYQQEKKKILVTIISSSGMFLLATLAITVPIIRQLGVRTVIPNTQFFTEKEISFNTLVSLSFSNTLGQGLPNVGLAILLIALVGFIGLKNSNFWETYAYILGVVLLLCSTLLFPWYLFKNTPVAHIQFMWRLLPFATFFLSLYGASKICTVYTWGKDSFKLIILNLVLVILALGSIESFITTETQNNSIATTTDYTTPYAHRLNSTGYMQSLSLNQIKAESAQYEDYVPFAANKVKTNVFNHQISINGHKSYLKSKELSPGYQQETYYLKNLKNKQSRIVLPFFIYNHKDYTAYVNGKKTKLYVTKKSLAQIYVRDTKNATITIRYTTPLIYIMARIVSLLIVIILIGMLVILLKRENKDD